MSVAWRRQETGDGHDVLLLTVHAQPGASRTEVAGQHGDALKVRLAAPPLDGKANDELRRYLAAAFGVPLRSVTLLRGESSRRKVVRIARPTLRPDVAWE
jgi:uncharacterized protein